MFQGLFSEKLGVVEKQEWVFKSDKSWSEFSFAASDLWVPGQGISPNLVLLI